MRKEYDFSSGARGKYSKRLTGAVKVVVLDADVAKVFPDSGSVNSALRAIAGAVRRQGKSGRRRSR